MRELFETVLILSLLGFFPALLLLCVFPQNGSIMYG